MKTRFKVNYNKISDNYNKRYNISDLQGISNSLENIITQNNYQTILEIGCGTGYWLEKVFRNNRNIFGCDLSTGMLKRVNNRKNKINLFCADADILPIMSKKFDLIFCVNALHHFPNKFSFVQNVKSILKENGSLAIYGVDPRFEEDEWYLYEYFNNSYENDLKRFPSLENIQNYFMNSGFKDVRSQIVEKVKNDRTTGNIFEDPFLQKGGTSQLALLTNNEYKTGISKIEKIIKEDNKRIFKTRITFHLITGKNI